MQNDFPLEAILFYEWLTVELAPTIRGNKPSTILSMVNTPCQALFTQWKRYGSQLLEQTKVRFLILRQTAKRETVLFYRPEILENCLQQEEHRLFLENLGYPINDGLEVCLKLLERRFQYACPHELGLLLGIPLKDVLGFMGMSNLPLTCRKEWCVYGNPSESIQTMVRFMEDRSEVLDYLAKGMTCYEIMCGRLDSLAQDAVISVRVVSSF